MSSLSSAEGNNLETLRENSLSVLDVVFEMPTYGGRWSRILHLRGAGNFPKLRRYMLSDSGAKPFGTFCPRSTVSHKLVDQIASLLCEQNILFVVFGLFGLFFLMDMVFAFVQKRWTLTRKLDRRNLISSHFG